MSCGPGGGMSTGPGGGLSLDGKYKGRCRLRQVTWTEKPWEGVLPIRSFVLVPGTWVLGPGGVRYGAPGRDAFCLPRCHEIYPHWMGVGSKDGRAVWKMSAPAACGCLFFGCPAPHRGGADSLTPRNRVVAQGRIELPTP